MNLNRTKGYIESVPLLEPKIGHMVYGRVGMSTEKYVIGFIISFDKPNGFATVITLNSPERCEIMLSELRQLVCDSSSFTDKLPLDSVCWQIAFDNGLIDNSPPCLLDVEFLPHERLSIIGYGWLTIYNNLPENLRTRESLNTIFKLSQKYKTPELL